MKDVTPFNNALLIAIRENPDIGKIEEAMRFINERGLEIATRRMSEIMYPCNYSWKILDHFVGHPKLPEGEEIRGYDARNIGEIPKFQEWIKYLKPESEWIASLLKHLIEGGANAQLRQCNLPPSNSTITSYSDRFAIMVFL